ncbi:MAG: hypothetical protein GY854_21085 [Deltaproteobacteria bacterium]|nr:hypothetical protein [Deltaproteobacteria bacterium]
MPPKPKIPVPRPSLPGPRGTLPRPGTKSVGRVAGLRLLIVDDDPARLDVLAAQLRELGAEVAVGGRVESGYSQAVRLLPDAVISDLASPGDPGWQLVQRMRRHPLLRWTPVLLLRWWEETGTGQGRVLVNRLLDRLEEVLAPLRVLKERFSTGRSLSESIGSTGPPALLRILTSEELTGRLTVNDAWSVFEVSISRGRLRTVSRRGVDGFVDNAEAAFMQLLLCDSGRWSFKPLETVEFTKSFESDLERALEKAGLALSELFHMDTSAVDLTSDHLYVRLDILAEAAPTLSTTAQRIAEAINKNLLGVELHRMVDEIGDPLEVERALQALVRCGAIRLEKDREKENRKSEESMAAGTVAYLLEVIHAANGQESVEEEDDTDLAIEKKARSKLQPGKLGGRGMYRVSKVKPERLASANIEVPKMPSVGAGMQARVAESLQSGTPDETTPLEPTTTAGNPQSQDEPGRIRREKQETPLEHKFFGKARGLIRDSLAPSPRERTENTKSSKQMWLAIALALLLGGILVAGLVFIASGGPEDPTPSIENE